MSTYMPEKLDDEYAKKNVDLDARKKLEEMSTVIRVLHSVINTIFFTKVTRNHRKNKIPVQKQNI